MEKIKMPTPLGRDGRRMRLTRILWKMIKDELLNFIDLKTELL